MQVQSTEARLAIIHANQEGSECETCTPALLQPHRKKKRRLQTSQKRLAKVNASCIFCHSNPWAGPTTESAAESHALKRCLRPVCLSLQFVHVAHNLLDAITPQLFVSKHPTHLLIAFGSTATRPYEVYSLTFPASGESMHTSDLAAFSACRFQLLCNLAEHSVKSLCYRNFLNPLDKFLEQMFF